MENVIDKKNVNLAIIASIILSMTIITLGLIILGIFPFGSGIFLRIDLFHQYAPFHEELRNNILSNSSFFYSWEGGLGKDFIAQMAYYTSSPFSLLILLFPQANIAEGMAFILIIKTGFIAGCFAYFMKKKWNETGVIAIMFSLLYTFCGFYGGFFWNIMWLDSVAVFPLVIMGLESLVKEKNYKLYTLSLAYIITTNFYMGYIICFFSVLFYLLFVSVNYGWKDKKQIFNTMVIFAVASLIAGGISAILSIPSFLVLQSTNAYSRGFTPGETFFNFNVLDFWARHFFGVEPQVLVKNDALPNVYTGLFTLFLAPLFFTLKNISKKEKIGVILLFVFMFFGFNTHIVSYAIHGMHHTSSLPHRYAYIYSFMVIYMSYNVYLNFDKIKLKWLSIMAIVYVAVIVVNTYFTDNSDRPEIITENLLIINLIFIFVFLILFYLIKSSKYKTATVNFLLIFVIVIEIIANNYVALDFHGYSDRNDYIRYMASVNKISEVISDTQNEFYRMDFNRFTTTNDSGLHHYKGLGQFSSTSNGSTSNVLLSMGVSANSLSYRYYDPTPLINSIFGVRYVMGKELLNPKPDLIPALEVGNLFLYENYYALPLGFMVNSDILDWDTLNKDPFIVQDDFVEKATGLTDKMYTDIPVSTITPINIDIDMIEENYFIYELKNSKDVVNIPAVEFTFVNPKDQYLYFFVDSATSSRVEIEYGNVFEDRDFPAGNCTFDVGYLEAGTEVTISFKLDKKGKDEKYFVNMSEIRIMGKGYTHETFDKAYRSLSKSTLNVSEYGDNYVNGSIDVKEDGVLFTSIPYGKGWDIYVDGEKTESLDFQNNSFVALELSEGYHEITMEYTTEGFYAGIVVSLMSLLIFLVLIKTDLLNKILFKEVDKKEEI